MPEETRFEAEWDAPCRAYIIRALTDKPVAYDEHSGHHGKPIMELLLPDTTLRYIHRLLIAKDKITQRNMLKGDINGIRQ